MRREKRSATAAAEATSQIVFALGDQSGQRMMVKLNPCLQGIKLKGSRRAMKTLARRHLRADFGAQLIDQLEPLLGLDMPEGPAIAGFGPLRHGADAVDRADLVAEHDGTV